MKKQPKEYWIGMKNGVLVCTGFAYTQYNEKKKFDEPYVHVHCNRCGKDSIMRAYTFSNKQHAYKACKHCRHEIRSEAAMKYHFCKEDRYKIHSIKSSAHCRNLPILLTAEEIVDIIHKPCVYCGAEKANGIDRIDSSIGYIQGNVVPCCSICNWMKNALSVEEFYNHIDKIHNFIHNEGSTTIPKGSTSQANGDGNGGILTAV